jgi:hypothetical protein
MAVSRDSWVAGPREEISVISLKRGHQVGKEKGFCNNHGHLLYLQSKNLSTISERYIRHPVVKYTF